MIGFTGIRVSFGFELRVTELGLDLGFRDFRSWFSVGERSSCAVVTSLF